MRGASWRRFQKYLFSIFTLYLVVFSPGQAISESLVRPPQGVAPIFYIMHDSLYQSKSSAGALGGWFWVTWKQIESTRGAYNWDLIENHLNSESGKTTRLKNGQIIKKPIALSIVILPDVRANGVPDYIYKETTGSSDRNVWTNTFPAYPKLNNQICTIQTCDGCECNCSPDLRPPWETFIFQDRFKALVQAFGDKYDKDPRVNSIWITTGLYGENVTSGIGGCVKGNAGSCDYKNTCRFDFNPGNVFGNWLVQRDILKTYRDAFPTKPLFIINSAPTSRLELTTRALQLSPPIGVKHNALEFDLPDQNNSDNDQWRTLNYYWDEIERKGLEGMVGFEHFFYNAPPHTYWALLAGLSRKMTLIDLPTKHLDVLGQMQEDYEKAQISRNNSGDYFPMWQFVEDHFGRNVSNTPSVWIVLRETAYSTGEPGDWEFYLYRPENIRGQKIQQDRPQAETVSGSMGQLPSAAKAQFIGRGGSAYIRRTNQANQNDYMYFKVDERWPALNTVGFDIEITYLDSGQDCFALKYGPNPEQEITVRKQNSNKFIRQRFELPDLSLQSINSTGDHFRIDCRNDGDEYIHMVRVIPKNWRAPYFDFGSTENLPPSAPTGFKFN